MHVDHTRRDTVLCEQLFGFERFIHQNTRGDNGHIRAVLQGNALADLEFRAVCIDRGKALSDEAHIGRPVIRCQLFGQRLCLRKIARIDHHRIWDGHVQRAVLKRHMRRAVKRRGHARVRADDMHRQLGIACGQERLVEHAAGGKAAK